MKNTDPTPEGVADQYRRVRALADRLEIAGHPCGRLETQLPHALGALRCVPGQAFFREPLRGAPAPPAPDLRSMGAELLLMEHTVARYVMRKIAGYGPLETERDRVAMFARTFSEGYAAQLASSQSTIPRAVDCVAETGYDPMTDEIRGYFQGAIAGHAERMLRLRATRGEL